MLYVAQQLLNVEKVKDIRNSLMISNEWMDGAASTSRPNETTTKRNLQLKKGDLRDKLSSDISKSIRENFLIKNSLYPAKIFSILFSRTGPGMFYKPHIDTPYLDQGRRDLSFTIFLNNPEDYDGGELILNIEPEIKTIKMKPGEMVIYPTKYLHEVKEVTRGERLVCVGWIESQIANDYERESLAKLNLAILDLIKSHGHSKSIMQINVAYNRIYKGFLSN